MAAVLDDLLGQLPDAGPVALKVGPGRGAEWLKDQQGAFAGQLQPEDWKRDEPLRASCVVHPSGWKKARAEAPGTSE